MPDTRFPIPDAGYPIHRIRSVFMKASCYPCIRNPVSCIWHPVSFLSGILHQFFIMEISINTPALLFPAISLLMLAYTNRFLALASLIRNLHSKYKDHTNKEGVIKQIKNLRLRLRLIRLMQWFGVLSLFLCVLCMFSIYEELPRWANILFSASLVSMLISLALSLWEIQISTAALAIELSDLEGLDSSNNIVDYLKRKFDKEE
jgi:hypothetical protein